MIPVNVTLKKWHLIYQRVSSVMQPHKHSTGSAHDTPRQTYRSMAPYALSKFDIPKGKRLISLSQNESMRAPSLMINDAVNRVINNGALYPDPEWTDLRSALAEVHGIDADAILCGTGSLDLIGA